MRNLHLIISISIGAGVNVYACARWPINGIINQCEALHESTREEACGHNVEMRR